MKLRSLAFYLLTLIACNETTASNDALPRLLIKIPTRSRPERLFKILNLYYAKLSKTIPYTFLISCDIDDATMNNETVIEKLNQYPHLYYYFGNNTTKVEAYNADMDKHPDFDIVLVSSDDMEPMVQNFDVIIVQKMFANFPDYDGVLNFHDGHVGPELNTYPIIGKKYYARFGYIYAPCYKSLFCDNELMNVSRILKKEKYINQCIIRHNHPAWGLNRMDELLKHNELIGEKYDRSTYIQRRNNNFYLEQKMLNEAMPKMWSILIYTSNPDNPDNLASKDITTELQKQISDLDLQDAIEILYLNDNNSDSILTQKTQLLDKSSGKYISYLNELDQIDPDYVQQTYEKLCLNDYNIDLIKTVNTNANGTHLNPLKRIYGCQFLSRQLNSDEKTNWNMHIKKAHLLETKELNEIV